ncbi:MAG: hypothetical protein LUE98_20165 [Tannerellaceae bacterium]|nr:hypothetical protein [Tannerellaceae bacterium]
MPQNKFALARYQLIDILLHRFDYVKTSFMVEYCFDKTGYKITRRTIQKDIDTMKYDPFLGLFAPIEYSSTRKAYFYTDKEYILSPFSILKDEILRLEELINLYKKELQRDHYEECIQILNKIHYIHR